MGLFRKHGKHETMSEFRKRMQKSLATTSKQLIWFYAVLGAVWISLSYVLAFMGKDQIAESLSGTVCTVIIGSLVTYLVTSTTENIFKYNDFKGRLPSLPDQSDDANPDEPGEGDVDIGAAEPD